MMNIRVCVHHECILTFSILKFARLVLESFKNEFQTK